MNSEKTLDEILKEAKKHGSFNRGNLFTVQFPSANNENKEKEKVKENEF